VSSPFADHCLTPHLLFCLFVCLFVPLVGCCIASLPLSLCVLSRASRRYCITICRPPHCHHAVLSRQRCHCHYAPHHRLPVLASRRVIVASPYRRQQSSTAAVSSRVALSSQSPRVAAGRRSRICRVAAVARMSPIAASSHRHAAALPPRLALPLYCAPDVSRPCPLCLIVAVFALHLIINLHMTPILPAKFGRGADTVNSDNSNQWSVASKKKCDKERVLCCGRG
jgi:hypothetical protein